MPTGCHHLTCEEQRQIQALKANGSSNRAIAWRWGRNSSAIARELKRDMVDCAYDGHNLGAEAAAMILPRLRVFETSFYDTTLRDEWGVSWRNRRRL